MPETDAALHVLATARWRRAIPLTIAVVAIYFGFICLIAFDKPLLGTIIVPGLSLGILLGALVIVASWLLTWSYIRWANGIYDPELARIKERLQS
jgi:uncharacterized membrane protein (DUF485 family)